MAWCHNACGRRRLHQCLGLAGCCRGTKRVAISPQDHKATRAAGVRPETSRRWSARRGSGRGRRGSFPPLRMMTILQSNTPMRLPPVGRWLMFLQQRERSVKMSPQAWHGKRARIAERTYARRRQHQLAGSIQHSLGHTEQRCIRIHADGRRGYRLQCLGRRGRHPALPLRSGTFDENNQMLKLGRVRVRLDPSPFGANALSFRRSWCCGKGTWRSRGPRHRPRYGCGAKSTGRHPY